MSEPRRPWAIRSPGQIDVDFRSETAAYSYLRDVTGLGHAAEVWHWKCGSWRLYERVQPGTSSDPLVTAREVMKQQAREARQQVTERWHNHSSRTACHPSHCPAGGTDWDGRGLVSDHFTSGGG
jgi:hypothetical protein